MEAQDLKRNIVQEAVTKLMDEHKVPARQMLQVVQELSKQLGLQKKDRETYLATNARHDMHMDLHEEHMSEHERQIAEWDQTKDHLLTIDHLKGDSGEPGMPGKDGISPEIDEIVEAVKPFIQNGEDGKDGKDAEFDEEAVIKSLIKRIQKEKPFDLSHIKGAQKFIKDGVSYKIEELMHGAGSSTSGGGFTTYASTEIPNGSITVFTFPLATAQPSFIISDNVWMKAVTKSGTVNWTWSGTQATMKISPQDDIQAVK